MEKRDPPSLLNRIIGPPLFLVGGMAAFSWFVYRFIALVQNIAEPMVVFEKGSCYLLGVSMGLLSLGTVAALEFWGGRPISPRQNNIFSKMAIFGLVLLFVFPHLSHWIIDKYLEKNDYTICTKASYQWLFIRDIVYLRPSMECTDSLVLR